MTVFRISNPEEKPTLMIPKAPLWRIWVHNPHASATEDYDFVIGMMKYYFSMYAL